MITSYINKVIYYLESIKEEQFNFKRFITEDDGKIPKTCCIIGWLPIWFPHWEIKYKRQRNSNLIIKQSDDEICSILKNKLDINNNEFSYLFLGANMLLKDYPNLPLLTTTSNLFEVINAWKQFSKLK